ENVSLLRKGRAGRATRTSWWPLPKRSSASWAGGRVTPICAPSSKPPGTGTAAIPRATMIDSSSAQQASAAKSLAGRTALVTGAGVGIGREIALALAGAGAVVGVHYHSSAPEARETLEQIENRGGKGVLLPGDLTVEERAIGIVEE